MHELTYLNSGVDINEGDRAVKLMQKHVKSTFSNNVLMDLGGFGGLYKLDIEDLTNPVLVSGTDGVGTKLKIAFMMDKHDTIGIDLVAMCVNDIICHGAKPLFFLDYIATGKLKAEKIENIIEGISKGCVMSKMALIGGETAEMPEFYQQDEYDLAGFAVGMVSQNKIITGKTIKKGDVLIGLSSSGIHSNGYSLVRKLFFEKLNFDINTFIPYLNGSLGEILLTPTKIYSDSISKVLKNFEIKGMCHITGGGFLENIPRIIPKNLGVTIFKDNFTIPKIFSYIQKEGNISTNEMFRTFNMGIGFILVVENHIKKSIMQFLNDINEEAFLIGEVVNGKGVTLV